MDWISDSIARMRNALMLNRNKVEIRGSKNMLRILDIMKNEGFIKSYSMKDNDTVLKPGEKKKKKPMKQACIVELNYQDSQSVIRGLKRISKPSLRVFVGSKDLLPFLKKFSMPIVSTSKGVLSGREAIEQNVGGELICEVR
jgi:small subunit ribosomal protein S8